jgi:cysteine desulfurase
VANWPPRIRQWSRAAPVAALRDRLWRALRADGWLRNGHLVEVLPNTLNASVDGAELLARAPEVAASTGSACHTGRVEPSAVLTAMGVPATRALGAVRLSLGRRTTGRDIDLAAAALVRAAMLMRGKAGQRMQGTASVRR